MYGTQYTALSPGLAKGLRLIILYLYYLSFSFVIIEQVKKAKGDPEAWSLDTRVFYNVHELLCE